MYIIKAFVAQKNLKLSIEVLDIDAVYFMQNKTKKVIIT